MSRLSAAKALALSTAAIGAMIVSTGGCAPVERNATVCDDTRGAQCGNTANVILDNRQ